MENSQSKKCTSCKTIQDIKYFNKNKTKKDGYSTECKSCIMIYNENYRRSKIGLIAQIYSHQKSKSKKRNHPKPTYTKQELKDWLFNQDLFHELHIKWDQSNYDINLVPSVDRKDNSIGYTIDNIQLMTWNENNKNANQDMHSADLIHGTKPQKAVMQYDLNNNFIKEYCSGSQAERILDIHQSKISNVCLGKRKTAGGFIWKFKEPN